MDLKIITRLIKLKLSLFSVIISPPFSVAFDFDTIMSFFLFRFYGVPSPDPNIDMFCKIYVKC